MRDIPIIENPHIERPTGIQVHRLGSMVEIRLPCGATALVTHGQALEVSAELLTAHNAVVRHAPGGAS